MLDETRTCTRCQRELALSAFAKDARLKSGVRSVCRRCDVQAVQGRRRGEPPPPRTPKPAKAASAPPRPRARATKAKPLALVLAPKFPDPPAAGESAVEPLLPPALTPAAGVALASTYTDAAEAFIAALTPPAGPADALHVHSLRDLARLADGAGQGSGDWVVRDVTGIVAKLVAVQRELVAVRARKAEAKPAGPLGLAAY